MSEFDQRAKLPYVGVIIPCYNHANYVGECIISVAKQDYPNKIIFISDEGSSDNSFERIQATTQQKPIELAPGIYQDKIVYNDTIIVYSKNPNPNGPSGARNRLIQIASKNVDFFAMLDADDYYLPGKLTKSMEIFQRDTVGNIGLVYTDANIYREKSNTFVREYREPYSRQNLQRECIISNTPVIRKSILEKVGLYDETMRTAEDWDLWLRITLESVAVHIPEALHVYRVTGKNASDVVPNEVWQANWQKIYERINGLRN